MPTFICRSMGLGFGLLLLAGCGRSQAGNLAPADPDALPFVQCSISMAGQPVEQAIVGFHSADGKSPEVQSSYDSEAGCYRFVTTVAGTKKSGVPAGNYTVTVKPAQKVRTKIPAKYADPAKSGLKAEIKPGENFLPAIELTP